jgi:chromate transporter
MILAYLELFWMFFKIGLFTFGGGYAMIPLFKQELVGGGYMTSELLVDFIGISESTPGSVAVNISTFIGMDQLGFLGVIAASLGAILPSFIIISLIAGFGSKFLQNKWVNHAFTGLRPVVIALIISVSVSLLVKTVFPNVDFAALAFDFSNLNYKGLIILIIVGSFAFFYKKSSPIKIIILSAILGVVIYGVI